MKRIVSNRVRVANTNRHILCDAKRKNLQSSQTFLQCCYEEAPSDRGRRLPITRLKLKPVANLLSPTR